MIEFPPYFDDITLLSIDQVWFIRRETPISISIPLPDGSELDISDMPTDTGVG